MKKQEIMVGCKYTDLKGNVRIVTGIGNNYLLYPGQRNNETLQYKLLEKKRGPDPVGSILNSTIQSFASWAKKKLEA